MKMQGRAEAFAAKSSPAPSRAPIELGQQPVDLAASAVAPAHGVTIELPRVADLTAPVAPQVKAAAAKPVTVKAPPAVRLERLSLAEVGLVTGPAARQAHAAPKFQPKMVLVKSSPHELEWRLTSIENAPQAVRTAELQVLNAVGRRGIAARMTGYLAARGWSAVRPADAPRSRQVSTIVYPASARLAANRLAARLPFPTALQPSAKGTGLVLLVGSNALPFDDRLRRTKTS
jgi:hypothetical protein